MSRCFRRATASAPDRCLRAASEMLFAERASSAPWVLASALPPRAIVIRTTIRRVAVFAKRRHSTREPTLLPLKLFAERASFGSPALLELRHFPRLGLYRCCRAPALFSLSDSCPRACHKSPPDTTPRAYSSARTSTRGHSPSISIAGLSVATHCCKGRSWLRACRFPSMRLVSPTTPARAVLRRLSGSCSIFRRISTRRTGWSTSYTQLCLR